MIERIKNYWAPLSQRDRIIVMLVIALVLCTVGYISLIEPALKTRKAALQALPNLKEQNAQLDALAAEANLLKAKGSAVNSPQAAQQTITQALERAGLKAERVVVSDDQRVVVTLKNANAGQVLAWLESTARENRLKIASASFNKPASPNATPGLAVTGPSANASRGLMDVEIGFAVQAAGT